VLACLEISVMHLSFLCAKPDSHKAILQQDAAKKEQWTEFSEGSREKKPVGRSFRSIIQWNWMLFEEGRTVVLQVGYRTTMLSRDSQTDRAWNVPISQHSLSSSLYFHHNDDRQDWAKTLVKKLIYYSQLRSRC